MLCSSDSDAALLVALIDFIDAVDEASVSEDEVLAVSKAPAFSNCRGHDFLKTRVNNIDLFGSLD